jgi:RecA-family ATPase
VSNIHPPAAPKLHAALAMARRGFAIFPLSENGTKPLPGSNGHLSATTDPDRIRNMWTDYTTGSPVEYNIGCSPRDGRHAIVDLDTKNGRNGIENYKALGGEIGGLVVRTKSGGLHVYLTADNMPTTAGTVGEGIDTRGPDGYVVAPGSIVDGAAYEIIQDDPMLPAPAWLTTLLGERRQREPLITLSSNYTIEDDLPANVARFADVCRRAEPACGGIWHAASRDLACEAVRLAVSPDAAIAVMLEHWVPRGTGFEEDGRDERWAADVEASYAWALGFGEHGMSAMPAQTAFDSLKIVLPPPDTVPENLPHTKATWIWRRPADLEGKPLPEREWIVPGWLSPGHTTLFYADGGTGKSLLAMQLMTSCATGQGWCGMAVQRCRTIGLFAEDDEAELHRRQAAINAAHGITFADLENMRWASGVGADNTLVQFTRDGTGEATVALRDFAACARDFGAKLLIVDTAADTYGGDEVVRRQVRQFVGGFLGGLAHELNAALVLNAHPSQNGIRTGDLQSGSTAWNNSARARWSLSRPPGAQGEADRDMRVLETRKANYGGVGDKVMLRWEKGVFRPVAPPTPAELVARQAEADAVFLRLLDRCDIDDRPVSISRNASNYAPKVFGMMPNRGNLQKPDFEEALLRLHEKAWITTREYGRNGARRIVSTRAADAVEG